MAESPEPERLAVRKKVVLWAKPPIMCTCRRLDDGCVEVCLESMNVEVRREVFSDPDEASRYAIDKMHAYNAG